jgi:hypothetical protein
MPKKKKSVRNMASDNFRWTPEDEQTRLRERYKKVCERNGFSFSGLTRALICHFVEVVEENSGTSPSISEAVKRTVRDLPKKKSKAKKN